MYLSSERLALANQTVRETFAQCSVAWQAIPHWDTGDPALTRVPDGTTNAGTFLTFQFPAIPFHLTLAQVKAPSPDELLTAAIAATNKLANTVDTDVLQHLYTTAATTAATTITTTAAMAPQDLQDSLIDARADVEDAGYRAPSCVITDTLGLKKLAQQVSGYSILPQLLTVANINALHRFKPLDPTNPAKARMVFLGRRRRIAQGAAAEASPGEEPVDLAVSVFPSLEVVGDNAAGGVEFSTRIRYVTRVTDATGLIAIKQP